MNDRGASLWTWLALLVSLVGTVAWALHEHGRGERAREERGRIDRLHARIQKGFNLEPREAQLQSEIRSVESQLQSLENILPPDLEAWLATLDERIAGSGLRRLEARIQSSDAVPGTGTRILVARVRVGRGQSGWFETLGRMEHWPLVALIRRVSVADPRHPESEAELELVSYVRESGPGASAATD